MAMSKTSSPGGSKLGDLSDERIAEFRRDGCTVVRGLCTKEEMASVRSKIVEAVADRSKDVAPLSERYGTYGRAFLQVENIWRTVPSVGDFTLSPRFAEVAARLVGVPGMRLYHDQALFKEPGGGLTPWHQDQGYWPLRGWGPVTMWMPLVDLTSEMGGSMSFARGSCHLALEDLEISDDSQSGGERMVDENRLDVVNFGPLAAGDATFHAGWTLHRAEENTSTAMREIMTVIYFPDGMRVAPPENRRQASDLGRWLPGCAPGDLAASELNPLLYSETQ
ncbi:MAG TPA: phytanoyl-CoA dioxygenase family protein [Acidimicrobiales bacterium]|nr:phytanoyl-CoA dioxygenase family protein [Acidimicrobiales bacterium]